MIKRTGMRSYPDARRPKRRPGIPGMIGLPANPDDPDGLWPWQRKLLEEGKLRIVPPEEYNVTFSMEQTSIEPMPYPKTSFIEDVSFSVEKFNEDFNKPS